MGPSDPTPAVQGQPEQGAQAHVQAASEGLSLRRSLKIWAVFTRAPSPAQHRSASDVQRKPSAFQFVPVAFWPGTGCY